MAICLDVFGQVIKILIIKGSIKVRGTNVEDPREEFYQRKLQQLDGRWSQIDPGRCLVVVGLLHAHDCLESFFNQSLQRYGLSSSAFNLLNILEQQEHQCLPLHEIGRLMVTSRANITGLMDSLCKRGLVERQAHPHDRRIKLARLLPKGQQFLDEMIPEHMKLIEHLTAEFSPDECQQLVSLLRKLRQKSLSQPSSA